MANPLVEQVLSGQAPLNLRKAAANGILPLSLEELIELWVFLRTDSVGEVRLACKESLAAVKEEEWLLLLTEHAFSSRVLDFAIRVLGRNPTLLHAALKNRRVPVGALEWLAPRAEGRAIDLMIEDQQRLIANPQLVAGLLSNPKLHMTQVRKLFDFSEQFCRENEAVVSLLEEKYGLKIGYAGGGFEKVVEEEEEAEKPDAGLEPETQEAVLTKRPAETAVPDKEVESHFSALEAALEEEPVEEEFKTLYQKILTMSVPAKVELALKGNKEARSLLIRDSNKVVQEAVLDSPKLTDQEIEAFSNMRGLSNDMFRKIARNRDWLKNYTVIKNLVLNPKVPPSIAIGFVCRLKDLDLKLLMKDKNVREVVRREGKKNFEIRFNRKVTNFKKKK